MAVWRMVKKTTSQATGETSLGAGEGLPPLRANRAANNQAHTARQGAIPGVIEQKSAEAIVA